MRRPGDIEQAKRLRYVRKTLGYTQEQMSRYLGLKQASYALKESGKSAIRDAQLDALKQILPQVNTDYIKYGEGEAFLPLPRRVNVPLDDLIGFISRITSECADFRMKVEKMFGGKYDI